MHLHTLHQPHCSNCCNIHNKFCIICATNKIKENIDKSELIQKCSEYNINFIELNKKSQYALEIIYRLYGFNIIADINTRTIDKYIYNDLYHKLEIHFKFKYGNDIDIYILHLFVQNRINNMIDNIIDFMNNNNIIVDNISNEIQNNKNFYKKHIGHVKYTIDLIAARLKSARKKPNTPYDLLKQDYVILKKMLNCNVGQMLKEYIGDVINFCNVTNYLMCD